MVVNGWRRNNKYGTIALNIFNNLFVNYWDSV